MLPSSLLSQIDQIKQLVMAIFKVALSQFLRNRFGMPFEIGQQGLGCIAALFAPNPASRSSHVQYNAPANALHMICSDGLGL